jgi:hypothetical protein
MKSFCVKRMLLVLKVFVTIIIQTQCSFDSV